MAYNIGDYVNGYRIKKPINGGGMSLVYLAESTSNNEVNKNVIIKLISKSKIEHDNGHNAKGIDGQWKKAIDELKLTYQIFTKTHENIAKPILWTTTEDLENIIIITEFVDGPTLSEYIRKQRALKIDRAMFYFKNICQGVKHLHQINEKRTIIHRDLKSDNIMLSKDLRQIKIIDYGIATSIYDNVFESSEGTIYCTANYTTPDILQLKTSIITKAMEGDPKAMKEMASILSVQFDFHALGVILYEMLTGSYVFREIENENDRTKIAKWKIYDLPILSNRIANIPNSIDNILFRLTASKPEDIKYRYKNIDEIIADINTWDDPARKNEPLLKPVEKRKFEQPDVFDIEKLKGTESWYSKWWVFILVNCSSIIVLLLTIIIIVLIVIGKL